MAPLTVLFTVVALLVGGQALFLGLLRLGFVGLLAIVAVGVWGRVSDGAPGNGGGQPGPGLRSGSRPAWVRRAGA